MLFFQENIFFSTFIKIVGSESISRKTKIKGFIWLCHVSLSVFYSHKTYLLFLISQNCCDKTHILTIAQLPALSKELKINAYQ